MKKSTDSACVSPRKAMGMKGAAKPSGKGGKGKPMPKGGRKGY